MRGSTQVGSSFEWKYWTRVKVTDSDKQSSLPWYRNYYNRKQGLWNRLLLTLNAQLHYKYSSLLHQSGKDSSKRFYGIFPWSKRLTGLRCISAHCHQVVDCRCRRRAPSPTFPAWRSWRKSPSCSRSCSWPRSWGRHLPIWSQCYKTFFSLNLSCVCPWQAYPA